MTANMTDVAIIAGAIVASVALSVFSVRWAIRGITRDIAAWEARSESDLKEWVQRQAEEQEKQSDAGGRQL